MGYLTEADNEVSMSDERVCLMADVFPLFALSFSLATLTPHAPRTRCVLTTHSSCLTLDHHTSYTRLLTAALARSLLTPHRCTRFLLVPPFWLRSLTR